MTNHLLSRDLSGKSLVDIERSYAEARFPAHVRSADWDARWMEIAAIVERGKPIIAYVRDHDSQLIVPVFRNEIKFGGDEKVS